MILGFRSSAAGAASCFALALCVFCITAPVVAEDAPVCAAPAEAVSLEHAPIRFRERIAQGLPIKIVAADPGDYVVFDHQRGHRAEVILVEIADRGVPALLPVL